VERDDAGSADRLSAETRISNHGVMGVLAVDQAVVRSDGHIRCAERVGRRVESRQLAHVDVGKSAEEFKHSVSGVAFVNESASSVGCPGRSRIDGDHLTASGIAHDCL
jgi:hypothetical protein